MKKILLWKKELVSNKIKLKQMKEIFFRMILISTIKFMTNEMILLLN